MKLRSQLGRLRRRVSGGRVDNLSGCLDGIDGRAISGWSSRGGGPLLVQLLHGDMVLATAPTALPRPDVAASGAGPLLCGFRFDVAEAVATLRRLDGGGVARPLSAMTEGRALPGTTVPVTADDLIDAAAFALTAQTLGPAA